MTPEEKRAYRQNYRKTYNRPSRAGAPYTAHQREYARKRYLLHRDEVIRRVREYRINNSEKIKATKHKHYLKNIDKIKQHHHKYYRSKKDYFSMMSRKWRDANHEKHNEIIRAYRRRNPEKSDAQQKARRRYVVVEKCERCGASNDLHRHHSDYQKPLEIIVLCRTCHMKEHYGD